MHPSFQLVFHKENKGWDACNHSTWEVEVVGSEAEGYSWGHRKFEGSLGIMLLEMKHKKNHKRMSQEKVEQNIWDTSY